MRVGLVTIIDEEFDAARQIFTLDANIEGTGYFVGNTATPGNWDVALLQASDRSNIPIMADVAAFMEDLRPQVLILLGIAGGLCDEGKGRDGIQPGDVLLADRVDYVEFLKLESGKGPLLRSYAIDHPSVPLRKNVSMPISKTFHIRDNLAGAKCPAEMEPRCKIHIGGIVSGEKVMGDVKSDVQQTLLRPFDKALAVDMESIGMARAVCNGRDSFWYHPRYVIIRGISDLVAAVDNDVQRAGWKTFAALAAAVVAREFVRRLPPDTGER